MGFCVGFTLSRLTRMWYNKAWRQSVGMVDKHGLEPCVCKDVQVRVLSLAQ